VSRQANAPTRNLDPVAGLAYRGPCGFQAVGSMPCPLLLNVQGQGRSPYIQKRTPFSWRLSPSVTHPRAPIACTPAASGPALCWCPGLQSCSPWVPLPSGCLPSIRITRAPSGPHPPYLWHSPERPQCASWPLDTPFPLRLISLPPPCWTSAPR
jgi:hypothetical protein